MAAMEEMKVTRLANWFGSAAMVRDRIAKELAGLSHVTIPFAGGMCELAAIDAAKMVVNDLHRHVINLARVMSDKSMSERLRLELQRRLFHPDELDNAQRRCFLRETIGKGASLFTTETPVDIGDSFEWAVDYFICSWMGRGGKGGTSGEFKGDLPIRFSPNGGGSAQRFQSAVSSIPAWQKVLERCEFSTNDAFAVIAAANDSPRCGIYVDPPWPDAGHDYRHPFTPAQHKRLADALAFGFENTRVVVRYGDHPLIRELYSSDRWTWIERDSRAQTNDSLPEVLIINGPSFTAEGARA